MYEHYGNVRGVEIARQSMARMMQITERYGGTVIRTQGDGVKSLFASADLAYEAAEEMQSSHHASPCGIKVAFAYGEIIAAQDDVFGDTVHLAARLLELARSGEILLPGNTAQRLSPDARTNTRLLDTTRVKGKTEPIDIFMVVQVKGGTQVLTNATVTQSSIAHAFSSLNALVLLYAGGEYRYEYMDRALSIGRAESSDLVVNSNYASRLHAQLELKRNYFLLIDQSTNGTYVANQGHAEVFIKRESVQLLGHGKISLGQPSYRAPDEVIEFFHESLQ